MVKKKTKKQQQQQQKKQYAKIQYDALLNPKNEILL